MSLATAVAAAIYFPLFLVRTAPVPAPANLPLEDDVKVVALPPYSELHRRDAISRSLYRWADIGNPTLLILPNTELGFSRSLPAPPPRFTASLPPATWTPEPQPTPEWPPVALTLLPPPPAQTLAEEWPQETTLILPAVPRRAPVVGVFWRDDRGRAIADPPICAEEGLKQALTQGHPARMTRLELQHHALLPIPRITIRQPSGNPGLDALAAQALRTRLETQHAATMAARLSGRHDHQSTRFSNCVLEVDWRLNHQAMTANHAPGTTP